MNSIGRGNGIEKAFWPAIVAGSYRLKSFTRWHPGSGVKKRAEVMDVAFVPVPRQENIIVLRSVVVHQSHVWLGPGNSVATLSVAKGGVLVIAKNPERGGQCSTCGIDLRP